MASVSDVFKSGGTLRRVHRARLTALAMIVVSACGGTGVALDDAPIAIAPLAVGAPPTAPVTTLELVEPATTSTTTALDVLPEPASVSWTAARAKAELEAFRAPGDATPFRVIDSHTILGTPTVVLVLRESHAWLEVMLPGRPNGETGWVRAVDVVAYDVARQAVIDLNTRTLLVLDGDEAIFEAQVGVGAPSSPTPLGTFYITDAVRLTDPHGPWGPYAFGLSARSDTITDFNGGDGIIGIHGTNRPTSIGEAQSLGCIRLSNDVMLKLSELLGVGSPVTIRA
jgi:lipoprotein-anchoring transpeptidase ErfK/SrfK